MLTLSIITTIIVLFLPGFFLFKSLGANSFIALSVSPTYAMVALPAIGIIFSAIGIDSNAYSVGFPFLLIPVLTLLGKASFRIAKHESFQIAPLHHREKVYLANICAYLFVGCVVGCFVFLQPVSELGSPLQSYDNIFNMNVVQHYVQESDWSVLHASMYPNDGSIPAPNITTPSYYPAAWHILCAFLTQLTHVDAGTVMIATLFVFTSVVFPIGICSMLSEIFGEETGIVTCGAICASAFSSFPWILLVVWPLYPNTVSTTMVPLFVALTICVTKKKVSAKRVLILLAVILFFVLLFGLVHPNAIFTSAVILGAYFVWLFWSKLGDSKYAYRLNHVKRALLTCVPITLFVAAWLLAYSFPPLSSTVNYYWPPIETKRAELLNIALLNYTGFDYQPVLAVLVIAGMIYCAAKKNSLWMVFSYLFSALILFVSATSDGTAIKQVLSGFWYTDPYRVACITAICAIPLASVGLYAFSRIPKCLSAKLSNHNINRWGSAITCIFATGIAILVYFPFNIGSHEPAFAKLHEWASASGDPEGAFYNAEEQRFVKDAMRFIDDGAIVLNNPYDGSALAYGLNGLNTYYRRNNVYRDEQLKINQYIKDALDAGSINSIASKIYKETGATYFLTLGRQPEEFVHFQNTYRDEQWSGIDQLDESVPGFELLTEERDMKLYKIEAK